MNSMNTTEKQNDLQKKQNFSVRKPVLSFFFIGLFFLYRSLAFIYNSTTLNDLFKENSLALNNIYGIELFILSLIFLIYSNELKSFAYSEKIKSLCLCLLLVFLFPPSFITSNDDSTVIGLMLFFIVFPFKIIQELSTLSFFSYIGVTFVYAIGIPLNIVYLWSLYALYTKKDI